MEISLLEDNFELKLNSTYRNVVDYLIISKNLKEGHWSSNPVKTSLCYKALEPIGELDNSSLTKEWMKEWFSNLDQFDLEKTKYRRNLHLYIEGAAEIISALNVKEIDGETAKHFFYTTKLSEGDNRGSWQNDLVLTSKVIGAFQKIGLEVPEETLAWIESQDVEQMSIKELANLIALTDMPNKRKYKKELLNRLNKSPDLTLSQISSILKSGDINLDANYISTLRNEIDNSDTFHINAGLTKALWQCVALRAASYPGDSIKKQLRKIDDRYWVDYIEKITEDSKIVLDLNKDIEKLMEGTRNIVTLANVIIALHRSGLLKVTEIPEKDYEELKEVQEERQKKELIGNTIIAEQYTTTFLGVFSGATLWTLAHVYGFSDFNALGIAFGNLLMFLVFVFLVSIGYKGGFIYGVRTVISYLKNKLGMSE